RLLCRPRPALRPERLGLDPLAAPPRLTIGRRPGLRRPVAGPGGLPRLVPHRLSLALRRLQPAAGPAGCPGASRWRLADLPGTGADRRAAGQSAWAAQPQGGPRHG